MSTTGVSKAIRPSRTSVATTTAVNILVTDASPNRVAGVFGTRAARSANPHAPSNRVSSPRVTRQQPDRSRSRSQVARVAAASAKRSSLIQTSCHHGGHLPLRLGRSKSGRLDFVDSPHGQPSGPRRPNGLNSTSMEIVCGACGSAVESTAKFCSSCGEPLSARCPSCGEEQPASASFCAKCGSPLRIEAASRTAAIDERQERRVVTILFADLAGSTALGERLDPEDVRDVQGRLFELVNGAVERFGGVSEKFVGDAVLAVFGIPRAHEDDPERAVRAALATHDGFSGFAATVADRYGVDVSLRIGVNTGEVVAGREAAARGELMVSGDAVNVAARLQQAADPGQVLVGARTRRATSRAVAYGRRTADRRERQEQGGRRLGGGVRHVRARATRRCGVEPVDRADRRAGDPDRRRPSRRARTHASGGHASGAGRGGQVAPARGARVAVAGHDGARRPLPALR